MLTPKQKQIIQYMQQHKPEQMNVTDRHKAIPQLSQRGFWNVMSHLERKELVARASGRNNDYVYFEGFYLTDKGKEII